jgi:3-deoxy-manno-octulosonate cytidylyltransferase (CMP-KDO synthetase)
MKITGIIPARFASSRFPGKALAVIHGKTMIRRVYEQAAKSKQLNEVIVATDDERIFKEVKNFGGEVIMTSAGHQNGTERCAEVAEKSDAEVIINIQGDEPFIQPEQIDLLAGLFQKENQIGTLIKEQILNEELQNPARIKVVVNKKMEALYFSRSIIPFIRNHPHFTIQGFKGKVANTDGLEKESFVPDVKFYKHIGIYGYRKEALLQLVKLPPSALEIAESLEQLRWLENGNRIQCAVTPYDAVSIDTPEDLEMVLNKH